MSELIELKIDARWKWAAKDGDGTQWLYGDKPSWDSPRWSPDMTGVANMTAFDIDLGAPADSLHQIIDGKLVKYVDVPGDGEKVIVCSYGDEHRRYSTGEAGDGDRLICYSDGTDKWTSGGKTNSWTNWRSPTPEELEDSK